MIKCKVVNKQTWTEKRQEKKKCITTGGFMVKKESFKPKGGLSHESKLRRGPLYSINQE